jgi:hypothetical protein
MKRCPKPKASRHRIDRNLGEKWNRQSKRRGRHRPRVTGLTHERRRTVSDRNDVAHWGFLSDHPVTTKGMHISGKYVLQRTGQCTRLLSLDAGGCGSVELKNGQGRKSESSWEIQITALCYRLAASLILQRRRVYPVHYHLSRTHIRRRDYVPASATGHSFLLCPFLCPR